MLAAKDEEAKYKLKQLLAKTPVALHENMGLSWFRALENKLKSPSFDKLNAFLETERKGSLPIYPPHHQVWSWTHHFDIKDTKVVILGQDPYHGPNQAHGLCFSVQKGNRPPPSLLNMFKELESDIEGFKRPNHGDLTGWAKQGVLLLNACLTVRQAKPNSHQKQGWEEITDGVIQHISTNCNGVVFLLWGAFAQKKAAMVNRSKHHILETVHPSPLSASRGFFGCKHFSKCNVLLKKQGKTAIDWNALD